MRTQTFYGKLKRACLATLSLITFSIAASGQCQTNSLPINTGYTTTGPIAVGTPDAHWEVVSLSTDIVNNVTPTPPATPYAAVITNWGWGATNPNSNWISFYHPTGAFYATTAPPDAYYMKLRRTFTMCQDDDIRVALQIARDNYLTYIKVDGNPSIIPSDPVAQNTALFNTWQTLPVMNYALTAGTHTIEVEVWDFHDASLPNQANPHGFNLVGTVSSASASNSIIDDHNCPAFTCDDECDDACFWKVSGNTIASNRNFFGTRSAHNVRIITNNTLRGVMTQTGLLGWNTMTPTSYLHVLCTGNRPDDGSAGSDIRFENLEPGNGDPLVIDAAGNVFRGRATGGGGDPDDPKDGTGDPAGMRQLYEQEKLKAEKLTQRLTELEEKVAKLSATLDAKGVVAPTADGNTLGQNMPNPFGKETVIEYNVVNMEQSASINIYDLNG
ncbi:MAG: hypothetical protein K0R82_1936, partial [Flavipsychrobacter sp.]|nr:hypothetical protein [Flavipsychrobacter sp.]